MLHEHEQKTARLNRVSLERSALGLLEDLLVNRSLGNVAMVSSFGAESAVLLHLVSRVERSTPVIFVDTQMMFQETLAYQLSLTEKFGLQDVRRITPDEEEVAAQDALGDLNKTDPDLCCDMRKTRPLEKALKGFDGWITGRKRFQANSRVNIKIFEADGDSGRIAVNPLAFWEPHDLKAYFETHDLPRHPLVAKGYPSIGCLPCTTKVAEGEDTRSGRWRGTDKQECGIHFSNGRIVRPAA